MLIFFLTFFHQHLRLKLIFLHQLRYIQVFNYNIARLFLVSLDVNRFPRWLYEIPLRNSFNLELIRFLIFRFLFHFIFDNVSPWRRHLKAFSARAQGSWLMLKIIRLIIISERLRIMIIFAVSPKTTVSSIQFPPYLLKRLIIVQILIVFCLGNVNVLSLCLPTISNHILHFHRGVLSPILYFGSWDFPVCELEYLIQVLVRHPLGLNWHQHPVLFLGRVINFSIAPWTDKILTLI